MTVPIALQLYTLRDALNTEFDKTIRRVAGMGYVGVESGDFIAARPAAAKRLFDQLGLTVTSAHYPLPLGERKNETLEAMAALHCSQLVSGYMDPAYYASEDGVKRVAELFNEAHEVAQANGLTLHIHNHDFEFQPLNGRPAIDRLIELIDPAIKFQLDTYWIRVAGHDPAAVVAAMGDRAPLLHLKDGPGFKEADMVAVGSGVMDFAAVAAAGAGHTQWAIVELDRCATDMMTAVEESYNYLTGNNLAEGKKV